MAIDKNSKAYQSLIKSGYTDDQINQMSGQVASGQSAKDVVANTKVGTTTTPTTTTTPKTTTATTTTASTNTAKPEYQGTGGSTIQPKDTSRNQGDGNYVYNPQSGYYEKQGSQTTATSSTASTSNYPNADKIRQGWDNMTYEQQQEALKKNPALKENIVRVGGTIKTAPTTGTTNTPTQTRNADGTNWDYQDNSQTRMDEIIGHLNDYTKTNPGLFSDYDTFYNAFIKGKGRTPEQEEVINDFFKKMKKYGDYDNKSSDEVGYLLAHGEPAEDYLSYLKYNDPQRYAEIQGARKNEEDKIKDNTALDTTNILSGESDATMTSKAIEWLKSQGLFLDKDGNLIDDRTENYATDEEKGYAKNAADIIARNLEIDNAIKNTYDDLVEKYPGATKSFLMSMAQDINSDLVREKENNNVELTRLQGYMGYMQSERQERNRIGESSMKQLQEMYGMYYDYSPEGMSELVQNKYAATNITLDQADNGTDTQKQIALQSVLDGYYDKYGSIIQRSEAQVINDVMALAKEKGISLSQALEENFLKPLRSKPEFATLSSGRSITAGGTDKWSVETIKDSNGNDLSVMVNQATGETRLMNGNAYTGGTSGTTSTGKSYNVVSPAELADGLSNFVSGYELGDFGGECGAFVNNGLKQMGITDTNMYGNSKESKLGTKNEDANTSAQTGWVAIWKPEVLTGDGAKYGHVGFVVQDNGDGTVKVLDSNGTKNPQTGKYDKTVGVRDVPKSSLYGYFNPSQGAGTVGGASGLNDNGDGDLFSAKVLSWIPTQLRNTDVEKKWYLDIAEKQRAKGLSSFETAMSIMGFDITNNSPLAQTTKQKILDATMAQGDEIVFNSAVLSSMAQSINKGDYEKALLTLENQLGSFMSKSDGGDLSRSTVSQGMKAINELNKVKNYKGYAGGAWNTVADLIGAEGKNTATFNVRTSNVSRALRGLGYEKEEIDYMLPKLTNDKATFNNRMDALEGALLGQYNTIRRNHNLPNMTKEALLGTQSLYDVYKLWNTEQLRNTISNARNRNLNLRYGQPITIASEAIKII